MLQDYENKPKSTILEKILPYIELALILIIIQSVILLFAGGQSEEEELRFRLLANSNAPADQQMKKEIQQEIEPLIENAVNHSQSTQELVENLALVEPKIIEIATSISGGMPVTLKRTNALFPAKRSGFVIHPQATYDAYIMTIGSGRGDNWWCAMFPKVCFVDENEKSDKKSTFFIWEWIKSLFSESY